MQTVKFVTMDKGKVTCWCTTNDLKMFRDFMQYILDSCNKPEDFIMYDVKSGKCYNVLKLATDGYKMRKRTFTERMENAQTGKWIGVEL